jgi:hypothetical protein
METSISCRVDNIIQNYCHNFLSYLYTNDGWKRTMFDMGKEVFIPSYIDKKREIRILISNTGSILITCEYVTDITESLNFIISQFEQNRMGYYIVDEDVKIKTTYVTQVPLNFMSEELEYNFDTGSINFSENLATLKYENYKDREELILKIFMIHENNEKENKNVPFDEHIDVESEEIEDVIEENKEDDLYTEFVLLASFFLWFSFKVGEIV